MFDPSLISTIISSASTAIALIALYMTRQDANRRERKDHEMFVDGVYEQFQEQNFAMLQDQDAIDILAHENGKSTKDAKRDALASIRINQAYRLFRLNENGYLNSEQWKQFRLDTGLLFTRSSIQSRWVDIQQYFPPNFREYINEKIISTSSPKNIKPMELTLIHSTANCDASSCPTIYQNKDGNFVIQGFKVGSVAKSEMQIPANEDAIEIPAEFLREFIEKMK